MKLQLSQNGREETSGGCGNENEWPASREGWRQLLVLPETRQLRILGTSLMRSHVVLGFFEFTNAVGFSGLRSLTWMLCGKL